MKNHTDTAYVQQRTENDCGIAALAMLYQLPYETSRDLVLSAEKSTFDGTTIDHARTVGLVMSDPCKIWYCTSTNRELLVSRLLDRQAILVVPAKDHRYSGDYHALYWSGRHVLDPAPFNKYGKAGIRALKSFIEVWVRASDDL